MFGRIRQLLHKYYEWKWVVWDEKTDFDVPFLKKIQYALKGFSANEYVWYQLNKNDWREYISEYERLKSREINGEYKFILDNKLVFEEVYSKYVRVPQNYAWISNGIVHRLHEHDVSNDNFTMFLSKTGKAVLKWIDRGGGTGTYLLEVQNDDIFINGKKSDEKQLRDILGRQGEALLCEYITQSDFSASLYPFTTNTIRIVCAKPKGEHNARIVAAIQRIGCKESIPVDNAHAGGMSCDIDMETGTLSYGIAHLGKMENRLKKFSVHPDTDTQISGKVIPNWETVKADILELTNKLPYLNFVAWDVLLTNEGFCVIEGNASSGCRIFQMEHGIRNSAFGDIYKSFGVIE